METLISTGFQLGKPQKSPTLEEVVTFVTPWLENRSVHRMKHISVEKDGVEYWGGYVEQKGREDENEIWRSEISIKSQEGVAPEFALRVGRRFEDHHHPQRPPKLVSPKILPSLIKQFGAKKEEYPVLNELWQLNRNSTEEFMEMLNSTKRVMPIVLLTPDNETLKVLSKIYPTSIARDLAGLGHTWIANGRKGLTQLEELVGEDIELPTDGGFGIYLQPGSSGRARQIVHSKVATRRFMNRGFSTFIFNEVAKRTKAYNLPITYQKIKEIIHEQQLNENEQAYKDFQRDTHTRIQKLEKERDESIAKGKEDSEIVTLYSEELDTLRKLTKSQDKKMHDYENQLAQKDFQLEQMRLSLEAAGIPLDTDESTDYDFGSVQEAYKLLKAEFDDIGYGGVVFSNEAIKGAKNSPFGRPQEFYDAIRWLQSTYVPNKNGVATKRGNLADLAKQAGLEYIPFQSEITKGRCKNGDYTCIVDGVTWELDEHFRFGAGNSPENCLRVAFAFDERQKRVIIGYVGKHQKNN